MKLKITVHGVAYEVDVEVLEAGEGFPQSAPGPLPARPHATTAPSPMAPPMAPLPPSAGPSGASPNGVASPIGGTVLEVRCKAGDTVSMGQTLLVLDAMKMKTNITASAAGKIKKVPVAVGDTVREGQVLVELE